MKKHRANFEMPDPVAQAAAEWAIRHDRGLSAVEQDDFSAWLAADARHRAAWAEYRWGWEELDRLAGLQTSEHAVPDPDLLLRRPPMRPRRWLQPLTLAAAVAVLIAVGAMALRWRAESPRTVPEANPPGARSLALIEQRQLADGSIVDLNRGAVLREEFTTGERRVRLDRGEAHFKVAKNAARPFIVEAGGVAVRAVGTAFNVRLESASVEVLVTEGRVGIVTQEGTSGAGKLPAASAEAGVIQPAEASPVHLNAGERTVVSLAPEAPPPQVTVVSPAELEARLAWQPRLLDFTATPLAEILAEFNRRNPVRLRLGDPALAELRLSATFRSDNVEGFVRLMESNFGMRAEWRADEEVVLFSAGPKTK